MAKKNQLLQNLKNIMIINLSVQPSNLNNENGTSYYKFILNTSTFMGMTYKIVQHKGASVKILGDGMIIYLV